MALEPITNKEIKIDGEDLVQFLTDYIEVLRGMGTFVVTMGNTEQKHPGLFETLKKLGSPETLDTLVEKLPPDDLALMFKTLVRFTRISQIGDVMSLPPEQKIIVGNEMVAISDDLLKLMLKARGKQDGQ